MKSKKKNQTYRKIKLRLVVTRGKGSEEGGLEKGGQKVHNSGAPGWLSQWSVYLLVSGL